MIIMANAYTNKVVVDGTAIIDLTADTVTAANLRSGTTAHGKDGSTITGTAASYVSGETLYVPDWMVSV